MPSADPGATLRRTKEKLTTIKLHANTSATPEQFTAGLTDFGPGRAELFGNSADGFMQIHDRGKPRPT
jgi:hypothetical protein